MPNGAHRYEFQWSSDMHPTFAIYVFVQLSIQIPYKITWSLSGSHCHFCRTAFSKNCNRVLSKVKCTVAYLTLR